MTRSFSSAPVEQQTIERCVELASRAPSAGKSQGWHLLLLVGDDVHRYWDRAFPREKRDGFAFPSLFDAPVVALSLADPGAYLSRYGEDDKKATGLGESLENWPAPYWTIDASFSTMTFLLALENEGLGALFLAHAHEEELRKEFGLPRDVQIIGTVVIGHRGDGEARVGRSASRPRRSTSSIIHVSTW